MSKLTETDILIAYDPYLTDLVHRYAPRIPFSDAFAEAQQELLLCISCYRAAYHGKFWSDYARPKICDCLKALQKAQNGRQHRERVHLDAQLKEDSTETFGKLLLVEQAKVTRLASSARPGKSTIRTLYNRALCGKVEKGGYSDVVPAFHVEEVFINQLSYESRLCYNEKNKQCEVPHAFDEARQGHLRP